MDTMDFANHADSTTSNLAPYLGRYSLLRTRQPPTESRLLKGLTLVVLCTSSDLGDDILLFVAGLHRSGLALRGRDHNAGYRRARKM